MTTCGGQAERTAASPRLVILYATCTVNKSYLSPYNPAIAFTPALDRFSGESLVFTKHHTEAGQTGIAFASMLSGTQAYRHGIYTHPSVLPDGLHLVSEAYAENGYEPFFWSDHLMASAALHYGQGVPAANTFENVYLKGDDPEFRRILSRLRTEADYRAFLMTSFTETHGPYKDDHLEAFLEQYPEEAGDVTPDEIKRYRTIYVENRFQLQWNFPAAIEKLALSKAEIRKLADVTELYYKSRIHLLDQRFGALIEEIRRAGLLDESLIVFTADHGEILYREHSPVKWAHGAVMLPEVLNVPLIVHAPTAELGVSSWDEVTRSIDLFPTMMGLSALPLPRETQIEGLDLTPALRGEETAADLPAYSHTTVPHAEVRERMQSWTLLRSLFPTVEVSGIWTGVRDGNEFYRWRYVGDRGWSLEAFDLVNDPLAADDIFDDDNEKHRAMADALRAYKRRLVANYTDDPSRRPSEKEAEAHLRSLGYIQ